MAFEEMARLLDDVQFNTRIMLFDPLYQIQQPGYAAKLITVSMNKQDRLAASGQESKVVLIHWCADTN